MEMQSRGVAIGIIGKAFLQVLVEDLGAVVILDGIDELPEGYRVRSHDLRGSLPEILIAPGPELRERVSLEACKLYAAAMRGSR